MDTFHAVYFPVTFANTYLVEHQFDDFLILTLSLELIFLGWFLNYIKLMNGKSQ